MPINNDDLFNVPSEREVHAAGSEEDCYKITNWTMMRFMWQW